MDNDTGESQSVIVTFRLNLKNLEERDAYEIVLKWRAAGNPRDSFVDAVLRSDDREPEMYAGKDYTANQIIRALDRMLDRLFARYFNRLARDLRSGALPVSNQNQHLPDDYSFEEDTLSDFAQNFGQSLMERDARGRGADPDEDDTW